MTSNLFFFPVKKAKWAAGRGGVAQPSAAGTECLSELRSSAGFLLKKA